MTKKDYQAIARAIYQARTDAHAALQMRPSAGNAADWQNWTLAIVQDRIANELALDSSRFNRARFIEACETGQCKGMRKVG